MTFSQRRPQRTLWTARFRTDPSLTATRFGASERSAEWDTRPLGHLNEFDELHRRVRSLIW